MSQDLQLNKLCNICERFATYNSQSHKDESSRSAFPFHNINELVQSAKKGCHLCNLVLAELLESQIRDLQRELEDNPQHGSQQLSMVPRACFLEAGLRLMHFFPVEYVKSEVVLVDIYISDLRGRKVRPPALNTGSPGISQMIVGWIKDCVCHHSLYCAIHRARTSRLPTRLLHIQKSGGTFHVNLCLGSEIGLSTSYATLSHVWGSGPPIKLLRKNMAEFRQSIPFARLPLTFADAIQLTNALGLSYLWIDSLCIIQDDPLDWEAESTAMCDVYRGSTINIAASASVDSRGGLFRRRNLLSVTPCVVGTIWGDHTLVCGNRETGLVAREPLSRRAWAVQERLLAPRTVHFTAKSVYFECYTRTISDIDPFSSYGIDERYYDQVNNWRRDSALNNDFSLPDGRPNMYLCKIRWRKVVKTYTDAQLTHESDKLIAIAGFAQFFQDLWPDPNMTYLAGLWSPGLEYWLLWRRSYTTRDWKRPKTSCAPSWSWASVEGSIEWSFPHVFWDYPWKTHVIEARTFPPKNPFSSVQSGYIRIRGRMCTTKGNKEIAGYLKDSDLRLDDGNLGADRMEDGEGLFLLLAVQGDQYRVTEALVLEYAGDQIGQYRRVGYFSTIPYLRQGSGRVSQEMQGFFLEAPKLAKHLYLDVNEDNEYTIDMI